MKPFRYERLARSLILEIASGLYREGAGFLSFRQIMKGWGVTRGTTEAAVEVLIERGVLERRNRSRFVVGKDAVKRARLLIDSFPGPELPPPTTWVGRVRKLVAGTSSSPINIALVTDPSVDLSKAMEEMRIADQGYPVEIADGRWELITFLRELNTRPNRFFFHGDDETQTRQEEILAAFKKDRPDGVVIYRRWTVHSQKVLLSGLREMGIPGLVVLGDSEGLADAHLDFNHVGAGSYMMKTLVDRGHRHIAVFTPTQVVPRFDELCEGALSYASDCCRANQIEVEVHRFSENEELLHHSVEQCFGRKRRPTAAIFTGMYNCIESFPVLCRIGIRVPADLSLFSRGSQWYPNVRNGFLWVDLMEQDLGLLGMEAARLIIRMADGEDVPHANLLNMPHMKGTSIAPPITTGG